MGEHPWDRQRRHRQQDKKFRTDNSRREIKILTHRVNITRLNGEIDRATRQTSSAEEKSGGTADLILGWVKKKRSALEGISGCGVYSLIRDEWHRCLESIDLHDTDAERKLKNLLQRIDECSVGPLLAAFEGLEKRNRKLEMIKSDIESMIRTHVVFHL